MTRVLLLAAGLAVMSAMPEEQVARIVVANAEKYPHHGKTVDQVLEQVQDAAGEMAF